MSGPLEGIKVLDLTTVVMGPLATQVLGDLGAEIIKVEPPSGDSNRYLSEGRNTGMSGIAMTLHRNKRSIVLNLKEKKAQNVLDRLVEDSDVLIHNMLPRVVASLGVEYDRVSKINPKLIYCSTVGFGKGGDYAGRPAYDDLIQGASGIAALMSSEGTPPNYFPGVICDKVTGLTAVYAVLAAVIHRQRTGQGQEVDVPMFETMVAFNLIEHLQDSVFVPAEGGFGYGRILSEHRRPYKTKDGYICVLPYSNRDWQSFFALIDRPELISDERFNDLASRTRHIDELYEIALYSLGEKTTDAWLEIFEKNGIAAMPILELSDIDQNTHIEQTGLMQTREHPCQGSYKQVGIPISFSKSVPDEPTHAPTIGQHTAQILSELGYAENEISEICEL